MQSGAGILMAPGPRPARLRNAHFPDLAMASVRPLLPPLFPALHKNL